MRFRIISIAILVSSVSGCAPIPHHELVAPEIRGVVESEITPVSQITILQCEPRSAIKCDSYIRHPVKPDGTFKLEADERFRLFTGLGDVIYQWGFNIEVEGVVRRGYEGESIGEVSKGPVRVVCNLEGKNAYGQLVSGFLCYETSNN